MDFENEYLATSCEFTNVIKKKGTRTSFVTVPMLSFYLEGN